MPIRFSLKTFLVFALVAGLVVVCIVDSFTKRKSDVIPNDILYKISEQYGHFADGDRAQEIVESVFHRSLNVGNEQYARAILLLSDGDLHELRRLASIPEDPRDTIIRLGKMGLKSTVPFGRTDQNE